MSSRDSRHVPATADTHMLHGIPSLDRPLTAEDIVQLRIVEIQLQCRAREVAHQSQLLELGALVAVLTRQLDLVKTENAASAIAAKAMADRVEVLEKRADRLLDGLEVLKHRCDTALGNSFVIKTC